MSEYFKVGLLKEPKVEFGNDFICDDPKAGIAIGGFFSNSNRSHRKEINIAIIGTPRLVTDALRWIEQFESRVTAKEISLKQLDATIEDGEIIEDDDYYFTEFEDENLADFEELQARKVTNKKLNPDFLGFNNETPFDCAFQNNPANNREIKDREYDLILGNPDISEVEKQEQLVHLIKTRFVDLIENKASAVDVCLIVLPDGLFKKVHSVKFGRSHSNFRRRLKAELIATDNTIPTQLIIEATIRGTKRSMQDLSMTAWNFCVASYYKAGCIPWALQVRESDTCFIGISFSKIITHENDSLRSSIAQAFNREGQGLVFTWKSFSWDSDANRTKAPHLEYGYAKELIVHVLDEYSKTNSHPPSRVVIHKTTDFWSKADSVQFNELDGLRDGILERLGPTATIDFVTIKTSPIKVLRNFGRYPVPRGTVLKLSPSERVLYTTGYIPYFELYPGTHIPHPLIIKCAESDSHVDKICEEILALTKLNFNNCSYYDSLPITIRFSKKVGEIIQYLPKEAKPQNKYYFYM